MPERIQNPHAQGDQRDKKDVGEHQAVQKNRELVLLGIGHEARGNQSDNHGRERYAQRGDRGQDDGKDRKGVVGQFQRFRLGFFLQVLGKHRNKGNRQRAFAQQAPEHIGNAKRHPEGVRRPARSEKGGDDHVPDDAENTADHCRGAHDSGGFGDFCIF